MYSTEPTDKNNSPKNSTSRFAKVYDVIVKLFPLWRNWISQAIDYNWPLACTAKRNLEKTGTKASLQQADVAYLPYRSGMFNTVFNTMAFTGYPDGKKAMTEVHRVLQRNGRFSINPK